MSGSVAETEARYEAREPARVRRPFTVEEFLRAAEAGVFDPDERLELVEGEIERMMTPIGPDHSETGGRIFEALMAAAPFGYRPRGPLSMRVDANTMLEPDLALLPRDLDRRSSARRDDPSRYPSVADAALVVEVADSSLADDLGRKARLYAKGGAAEYWVADACGRRMIVHREPSPEGYGSIVEYTDGAKVSPAGFPGVVVDLAEIFGGGG